MANHAHHVEVRNPGPVAISPGLRTLFILFAVVGIAGFLIGVNTEAKRAWSAFTLNHFYFMSLAVGGVFFAAIQILTNAMWSAPIRRVAEAFSAYLPVVLVSLIVLYFGRNTIYKWTDLELVKNDIMLSGKSGYLSVGFFWVRNIIAVLIWIFFSWKIIGNSLRQDVTKDIELTKKNRVLSPIFIMLFAITFTMASFDQMMSLDPHWFSTMFGVHMFSGLFYSTLALLGVTVVLLRRSGALKGIVTDDHLHDVGKFMFAFTVFWAYIFFSQYMLIWYANLPEETGYLIRRLQTGGWMYFSFFLILKFLVPFFGLMSRDAKRSESRLLKMGIFMLVAQWLEVLWVVQPEFYSEGPRIGWIEGVTALGFLGLFGLAVTTFMSRNNILAVGDPRLPESLHHHQ